MFTGLIEEIGTVKNIRKGNVSSQITIGAQKVLEGIKEGNSICTNGACLTVIAHSIREFTVDVMAETMRRTNLHKLTLGDKVNLERALKVGDRLGGHIVSGHVDGIGTILQMKREENAIWITISVTNNILKYIVEKGSVTIDGISLTIAEVDDKNFRVSVIPHTGLMTTLLKKQPGDELNIENDIVGKYIEKFISLKGNENHEKQSDNKIDMNFLKEHGF